LKPRQYGWTLAITEPEIRRLSPGAEFALRCAQALGRNAQQRRIGSYQTPSRLTLNQIAAINQSSAIEINNGLKQARLELFGKNLSDSAAYNRIRQQRQHGNRTCTHPDCNTPLPTYAHTSRRYCKNHATPTQRVTRHRRSRRH
jgi:hypothetical protein